MADSLDTDTEARRNTVTLSSEFYVTLFLCSFSSQIWLIFYTEKRNIFVSFSLSITKLGKFLADFDPKQVTVSQKNVYSVRESNQ